jgi:hypothetical protein
VPTLRTSPHEVERDEIAARAGEELEAADHAVDMERRIKLARASLLLETLRATRSVAAVPSVLLVSSLVR